MSTRILDIEDLKVCYSGLPVLQGISLHMDAGETVSVLGTNGTGMGVNVLRAEILQSAKWPRTQSTAASTPRSRARASSMVASWKRTVSPGANWPSSGKSAAITTAIFR